MEALRKYSIGFTLFEILIAILILGILAAIAIPEIQNQSQRATEAATKETLQKLRTVIGAYAAQHKGVPPGYPNGDMTRIPATTIFTQQLCSATNSDGTYAAPGTAGYPLGPYLSAIPENPFNDSNTVTIYKNSTNIPASASGTSGWIYKPLTKTIKLNYASTDSEGIRYYDY
jgi:prepilin-type N-terminal cleavage/methylation domain-containing protein